MTQFAINDVSHPDSYVYVEPLDDGTGYVLVSRGHHHTNARTSNVLRGAMPYEQALRYAEAYADGWNTTDASERNSHEEVTC